MRIRHQIFSTSRWLTRVLLGLLCLLAPAAGALAQTTVSAIRVGEHPDKTRFVMELSEAPRYRVFTLPDPFRVVVDLSEIEWRPEANGLPKRSGAIEAMRFGLFAPGTSRLVLDLKQPVRVKSVFLIPPRAGYPHRFVLDLAPITRQAYFARSDRDPILSDPPLAPPQTAVLAPQKPKPDARPLIIVDPGHGGVDPGARSRSGVDEKEIALSYGFELKRQLEATGRYRVAMTRDRDIFVRLRDRIAIAERLEGDLFLSLHANNHDSPRIHGASVYTLSEKSSDAQAAALAAKENKADIIAGVDLSDQPEVVSRILIDLAQRETMNLSKQFANTLVAEVGAVTPLLNNAHRFAGFAVLKSPSVPSVLVEIGYLSHPSEERMLLSQAHRRKVIAALIEAIDAYFARQESLNRS